MYKDGLPGGALARLKWLKGNIRDYREKEEFRNQYKGTWEHTMPQCKECKRMTQERTNSIVAFQDLSYNHTLKRIEKKIDAAFGDKYIKQNGVFVKIKDLT
jgi:hypothetical protein